MQVCTCIPNGYCRSSAGTLTKGGQYGSKGRGVEPWDKSVARPVRANGNGRGLPLHSKLRHDPSQLIPGTPVATAVSLLWRCRGPRALAGSLCHLSSGALAGSIRDCRSAPAARTAGAGSLPSPPGDGMDQSLTLSLRTHCQCRRDSSFQQSEANKTLANFLREGLEKVRHPFGQPDVHSDNVPFGRFEQRTFQFSVTAVFLCPSLRSYRS